MIQLGFLAFSTRLQRIDKAGDPLEKINTAIDWEAFRPRLEKARKKDKKSAAGAKGFDIVLLFKAFVLQSLYNLYDEAMEFQVLDRYSFPRFLGLHAVSKIPDATTIRRFREDLTKADVIGTLFSQFDHFLNEQGFRAQKGQIIDVSIVRVPSKLPLFVLITDGFKSLEVVQKKLHQVRIKMSSRLLLKMITNLLHRPRFFIYTITS